MAIYLPYQDFRRSAKCLTDAHLDEQRITVKYLIYDTVVHHRSTKWDGHMTQLLEIYEATLCELSRRRGDRTPPVPWMLDHADPPPAWLGDPAFHGEERMRLLRLNPAHYERMKWR